MIDGSLARQVGSTVEALSVGDFEAAGKRMVESHMSLKDDFEVSVSELDTLVELATGYGGVYGARMTGGGFGGCIVSLVKPEAVEGLIEHLRAGYFEKTGIEPESFVTRPGIGASALTPLQKAP